MEKHLPWSCINCGQALDGPDPEHGLWCQGPIGMTEWEQEQWDARLIQSRKDWNASHPAEEQVEVMWGFE